MLRVMCAMCRVHSMKTGNKRKKTRYHTSRNTGYFILGRSYRVEPFAQTSMFFSDTGPTRLCLTSSNTRVVVLVLLYVLTANQCALKTAQLQSDLILSVFSTLSTGRACNLLGRERCNECCSLSTQGHCERWNRVAEELHRVHLLSSSGEGDWLTADELRELHVVSSRYSARNMLCFAWNSLKSSRSATSAFLFTTSLARGELMSPVITARCFGCVLIAAATVAVSSVSGFVLPAASPSPAQGSFTQQHEGSRYLPVASSQPKRRPTRG